MSMILIADGINPCNIKVMHKAISGLSIKPELLLIDGNRFTDYKSVCNNIIPHKCIIKGDQKYYSIACASILAKEYHDEYIQSSC